MYNKTRDNKRHKIGYIKLFIHTYTRTAATIVKGNKTLWVVFQSNDGAINKLMPHTTPHTQTKGNIYLKKKIYICVCTYVCMHVHKQYRTLSDTVACIWCYMEPCGLVATSRFAVCLNLILFLILVWRSWRQNQQEKKRKYNKIVYLSLRYI